jgi:hypothetical protein
MKKVILLVLLALLALFLLMRRSSSSYGESRLNNQFVALCPPGQMPASYTASGGDCVPYKF